MGLGDLIKGVGKGAGKIAKGAGKAVGGAAKAVGQTAGKAGKTVGKAAGGVVKGAGGVVKGAGKVAGGVVKGAGKVAGGAAKTVGKTAGTVAKGAGTVAKGAAKVVGKAGSGAVGGAKSVVKGVAGAGKDIVTGVAKTAGGVAGGGVALIDVLRHAATLHFKDIPKDLKKAGKSLFASGKALVGVAESAGALYVWTNGAFVPVVVAGAAVANVLIKHRSLTADEIAFARRVFLDKIPYRRVVVTNLHSNNDRAFTIPNVDGDILLNVGPGYDNLLTYTTNSYPTPGQLFIHEMTHAWQIAHTSFLPGLICEGIVNQTRHTILKTKGIYDPGKDFTKGWSKFNAEQQGTIVDSWFMEPSRIDSYGLVGGGMSEGDPLGRFHYVSDNIRTGRT